MNATAFAEEFPVGEHLAEELEARDWTQGEFAEILGRPAQFVSEIIAGKKEITRESAAQIGAAFGTTAEYWLNLQDSYHLWRQGQDERRQTQLEDVRLRARLKELAPVSVLLKRGFIKESSPRGQARELQLLYGMESIHDDPDFAIAARRSNVHEMLTATQMAWLACVRSRAASIDVGPYSESKLLELAQRISRELVEADRFGSLPADFAAVGVRLVFVEAFPSSKLDGCTFMLNGTPVIGLSGRGKRLDKVLFTLLHEIAHILLGHLGESSVILDDPDSQHTLGVEQAANELAGTWILPKPLPPLPDRLSAGWVRRSASDQGVHPIVLIGRLQSLGRLTWRTPLVKGAPNVVDQLFTW
jgi:HTH-type transcriptional regulator/antitoxin HigA